MERKPSLDKEALNKLLKEMAEPEEEAAEPQGYPAARAREPEREEVRAWPPEAPPQPSPTSRGPAASPSPALPPSPPPPVATTPPSARPPDKSGPPASPRVSPWRKGPQEGAMAASFKGPVEIEVQGPPSKSLLEQLQGEVGQVPGLTYQGTWASARGPVRLRLQANHPLPLPQLLRDLPSVLDLQVKEMGPILRATATLGERTPSAPPPETSPQKESSLASGEATFTVAPLPGIGDLFRLQETLRAWPEVKAILKTTTTLDGKGAILTLDLGKEVALEEAGKRLRGADVELEAGNKVKVALPSSW